MKGFWRYALLALCLVLALTACAPGETPVTEPEDPSVTGPSEADVTEPTDAPTEPTNEPSEPTAPPTEPTASPTEPAVPPTEPSAPAPEDVDYETYNAMSGDEQLAFLESFDSMQEFFDWYNAAKAKYEAENPGIEIGPGGTVDIPGN